MSTIVLRPHSRGSVKLAGKDVHQLPLIDLGLLTDEPRRLAMAAAAREWAMRVFSWDVIADQLDAVYSAAVQGAPHSVPSRVGVSPHS